MAENGENIPVRHLEGGASDTGEIKIDDASLIEIQELQEDPQFSLSAMTRMEVSDYGDECFLLKSVITPQECNHFINEGENQGFDTISYAREDYRSSKRISFRSPQLSSLLWKRIQGHLENIVINGNPQDQHIEGVPFLMQGTWVPKGLNDVFRLCRYLPGGHFSPHNDGFFMRSTKERSLKTFMLYLNGDFTGGSTNFIDPSQTLYKDENGKYCAEEKNILCRVQPETGLAIIFNHNRLHEGEKLGDGKKYILRTDVMYENISESAVSSKQEKAMSLLQDADRLESAGKCMEAMELYRKAYKLCPELENAYSGTS